MSVTERPVKPNKEAYQTEMDGYSATINKLIEKLKEIQAKIPAKDSNTALGKAKTEARATFDSLLNQKKVLTSKRTAMIQEVANLKTAIKKKEEETRASKSKIGWKSIGEIDAQVAHFEKSLQKGGLTLQDEKKIVAEISKLKGARKALDSLNSQPSGLDADKAKIEVIDSKIKLVKEEIKVLDPKVTAAKEALDACEKLLKSSYGSISSLIDEKKKIQDELNDAKEAKTACYQNFKSVQDNWYAYEREQKQKQAEVEKAKRAAEREARMVAQAEQELEDAEVAAFSGEIAVCDALTKFFKSQLPSDATTNGNSTSDKTSSEEAKAIEAAGPRSTVLVRKGDREEESFMALGNKKKQNKRRGPSVNKPLKMDLELIDQLSNLSIEIPKSNAAIPATLEALAAKKKHFLETSAAQTSSNRKAALEKIEKLKAASIAEAAEELSAK